MELKIFKIKKHFRKGGIHIAPDIFWIFSLAVGVAIVLASIVFGFYLFREVNNKSEFNTESSMQADAISRERINKVLMYFAERKNRSQKIINEPSPVIDPSL